METSEKRTSAREDGMPPRPDAALLRRATDWMLRLEADPDNRALRRELDAWLDADDEHRGAWRRVRGAWELIGEAPSEPDLWPADPSPPAAARRYPPMARLAGTALAACLLLAVLPAAWRYWQADYRTPVGDTLALTLSDGSQVVLGADSALATDFSDDRRRVRLLEGEAFFEVAADRRPFLVQAGDMQARDIGTAFNVRADDQGYAVAVSDGEVAVRYREGEHRLLAGDQLALTRDGAARRYRLPPDRVATWRQGRLFVQDRTLADLAATLERYAPGYILIADGDLAARRVTGSYDLTDIDAALGAMVQPHGGRVLRITPLLRIVL
ncbi:FecR family protein [Alloalcanivorax marinus]|uniref:FecR family protein n=1 Tax=Alloalcanivorax marinus TaxID=1177169 RepID=UPI0019312864|nr:FecR domain-containing protein [Alloalcanivorax marinus]MBL7251880.1 FecR domain-containing protein [Alloalcanivorax marinus]